MIDLYKNEKWLEPNIENLSSDEKIQISSFGRIRSFKVSLISPKIIGGSWINGYNAIVLRLITGKSQTFYIHKLVAELFVPKLNPLKNFIVHLDFDKSNNHYSNLSWVNKDESKIHKLTDVNYNTKKIRNSKLTEVQVIKIKKMLRRGTFKPFRIAQQFGISLTQLARIKDGRNWNHIDIS